MRSCTLSLVADRGNRLLQTQLVKDGAVVQGPLSSSPEKAGHGTSAWAAFCWGAPLCRPHGAARSPQCGERQAAAKLHYARAQVELPMQVPGSPSIGVLSLSFTTGQRLPSCH